MLTWTICARGRGPSSAVSTRGSVRACSDRVPSSVNGAHQAVAGVHRQPSRPPGDSLPPTEGTPDTRDTRDTQEGSLEDTKDIRDTPDTPEDSLDTQGDTQGDTRDRPPDEDVTPPTSASSRYSSSGTTQTPEAPSPQQSRCRRRHRPRLPQRRLHRASRSGTRAGRQPTVRR